MNIFWKSFHRNYGMTFRGRPPERLPDDAPYYNVVREKPFFRPPTEFTPQVLPIFLRQKQSP